MNNFLRKRNLIYLFLGIILTAHVFILTKLIYFPYPELFVYPYLTNHGLKPYSQILDQHFPGLMFLPINFDNLGMNTPEAARMWSISIVVIIQLMLFLICSRIFKSKDQALVVNALYLVWQPFFEGWVLWIDSFLPLLLLPAFYTTYKSLSAGKQKNKLIFLTGLLLGIAVLFKQVIAPLSLLVLIYLFWQSKKIRTALIFLSGFLPPIFLLFSYFLLTGVWSDFWYWTVVFNLTVFAKYGRKAASSVGYITRVVFVFGTSALAFFSEDKKLKHILAIFIIGSLAGVFARFDFVHFQPALPFVLIATVAAFYSFKLKDLLKIIVLVYLFVIFWWLIIFYKGHISDRIIMFDNETIVLAGKIQLYTKPGEKIFILGAPLNLYQMTQTLPAGDIFFIQAPWFFMVGGDRALDGIKKDQPEIVVVDRSVVLEGYKITEFAKKIDQYISQNYKQIDGIGTASILRRISP